jgi:flagellar protein FlbD
VILVTRLSGPLFALNPDLIERADSTPDTVVTLVDGTKYVITETLAELIELIHAYRADIVARSHRLDGIGAPAERAATAALGPVPGSADHGTAPVVPLHRKES